MERFHAESQSRKARGHGMVWLLGMMLTVAVFGLTGCSKPSDHSEHSTTPSPQHSTTPSLQHSTTPSPSAPLYWCPMHPEVTSTDPNAQCDKCGGMKLMLKEADAKPMEAPAKPTVKGAKYFCPMHPQITSNKPGDCPICNMRLVPVGDDMDSHAGHDMPKGLASVKVSPEVRQRIGLTVAKVETRQLHREIRTSARIVADETRQHRVTTKIEGWVDKLFVSVTGQQVKAGDPLLTVYAPELYASQQEYLIAHKSGSADLLAAAKKRLELLDVTDQQIADLEKNQKAQQYLTVFAPTGGFVSEKMVLAGQKIMPGEPLMVVSDLSVVWADADLYQSDLGLVKLGMPVTFTLPSAQDKAFAGKVIFVTPTIDPMTRTAKARLEIPNPDQVLKPEMFGNAALDADLGESLAIPTSAVLRDGTRAYAFRDEGEGRLMPVVVSIGVRSGDFYQLLSGLRDGDQVVNSANFLVDSESQLKAALSGMGAHEH